MICELPALNKAKNKLLFFISEYNLIYYHINSERNCMKILLFFVFLLFSNNAFALEADVSLNGTTVSYDSSNLFNFSDKLLEATENCLAYEEDFTENNPILQDLGKMMGGAGFSVKVKIFGEDNQLCHFSLGYGLGNLQTAKYDCNISKNQQIELLNAMKSRSTEEVSANYISYSSFINSEGTTDKLPVQNKVTGNLFDVTLAKILGENCVLEETEPSEEELSEFEQQINKFSDSFTASLKNCQPDEEEINMPFMNLSLKIVGKSQNICKLEFADFALALPLERISELNSFDSIDTLIKDKNIAEYKPDFSTYNLLFALSDCAQYENYEFGISTKSYGDVTVKQSLSSSYKDGVCNLKFTNLLLSGEEEEDYSLYCNISYAESSKLLLPYKELIEKYGQKITKDYQSDSGFSMSIEGPVYNEPMQKAGENLFEDIKSQGLCKSVNR